MKICSVGAMLFYADGYEERRTNKDNEANIRISQFFEKLLKLLLSLHLSGGIEKTKQFIPTVIYGVGTET
jgi:hypothetical protein